MKPSEWEPGEDEILGRLVDLEMEKEVFLKKKKVSSYELEAIEAEQEMLRRLYHG